MLVVTHPHAERAELAGAIPEEVGELIRDLEHVGPGVGGLLDDGPDAKRVVAVLPPDVVVLAHVGSPISVLRE